MQDQLEIVVKSEPHLPKQHHGPKIIEIGSSYFSWIAQLKQRVVSRKFHGAPIMDS